MSEQRGVLTLGIDAQIMMQAKEHGLVMKVRDEPDVLWDKTLIATSGVRVPWDLLPAAWHFLERWDAAVPLWRYGVTAEHVGTSAERRRTAAIVRDLRVLLYYHELLFVRRNAGGRALIATWLQETRNGGDPRLVFLRAFYRVKPRLCVLPRSWTDEVVGGGSIQTAPSVLRHPRTGSLQERRERRNAAYIKALTGGGRTENA